MMKKTWFLPAALLTLALAGCGTAQNRQAENTAFPPLETIPALPDNPQTIPTSVPAEVDFQSPDAKDNTSAPRKIIEKVKTDLAKQLKLNADQIRVVESRAVDWHDTSLGCPQPDMVYAQVETAGYWVLLEAEEKSYPYHTDQNGLFILCLGNASNTETEAPLPVIPVNPDGIDDGQPWVPVD